MADPNEAFSVMDFEEAAHRKVDPAHWAYPASGVDDDATLHANREGFQHIQLRPRRLRDASKPICGRTCSARCTTAPYLRALPPARNFLIRMASSR